MCMYNILQNDFKIPIHWSAKSPDTDLFNTCEQLMLHKHSIVFYTVLHVKQQKQFFYRISIKVS
jgi:hypothetical protein